MFFLVLGGTETIKHPGISAAGASPDLLPYTAALDAEYICLGKTLSRDTIPVSPAGIVSPALITRKCLELLKMPVQIINAGAPIKPQLDDKWMLDLETKPAKSVETGMAIKPDEVLRLYQAGRIIIQGLDICRRARQVESEAPELTYASMRTPSEQLTQSCGKYTSPIVFAECVVGGTTTAQGLLRALGYKVTGLMSSSIPEGNHSLKHDLVEKGYQAALAREDFSPELVTKNPLLAISAMGDPMQAVVAGMVVACLEQGIDFKLAGGSQMIAIASLVEAIVKRHCKERGSTTKQSTTLVIASVAQQSTLMDRCAASRLAMTGINIITTPWVMNDKSARIQDLLKLCTKHSSLSSATGVPTELADLALEAYDLGHVKEGVGAGALMHLIQTNTANIN